MMLMMTTMTMPFALLGISGGYELLAIGLASLLLFSNRLPRRLRKIGNGLGEVKNSVAGLGSPRSGD